MRFKSYAMGAMLFGLGAAGYWLGTVVPPPTPDTFERGEPSAAEPRADNPQVMRTPRERIGSNGPEVSGLSIPDTAQ